VYLLAKNKIKMSIPYFQVPNDIFDLDIKVRDNNLIRELRTSEKLVYIYLCRCGNQGSDAFPSYNTIADKCGISRRKAIDAIKLLYDNGLLLKANRTKDNGDNSSNIYEVILPSATIAPPPSATIAPPSATIAPYKEPLYKEQDFEKEPPVYIPLKRADICQENLYVIFYNECFERYMKREHPKVTQEQINYIERSISKLRSEDIDFNNWQEAVLEHFQKLPKKNNGNILAFLKASFRYFEVNLDIA
jgi:hypothetical protein